MDFRNKITRMTSRKRPRDKSIEHRCLWRGCDMPLFDSEKALYDHVNTVHVTAGPCLWGDCEYVGKTKQLLQIHLRRHTGEKPYKCDICDYSCAVSCALTSHKRRHTGKKPYKCDVCEAAFAVSGALTSHKRTHTGEKPFKCDLCEAAFAVSGSLKRHKRTHTGEKPYKCDVCNATFTLSGNLAKHKRTHTGEKPYKCDLCDYASVRSCDLTSHVIRKHLGPWCVLCSECWVPEETMICGRCNMGQTFGAKERAFFEFLYNYDERLAECCFTLRDQAMGCGVRKRPDGLMQLQTKAACVTIDQAMEAVLQQDDYRVKLIIEADEHQHQAYEPSCELARLQEIQERDQDAVYVMRYNVDQPGGLEEEKLTEFCDRLLYVLDGGFLEAVEAPTLFAIEYFGYSENRLELLWAEMDRQLSGSQEADVYDL